MQLVRKKLSASEITPANIRYDAGTDAVQQSSDGGTTWNPAPGLDPRSADSFRVPANASASPQCNAAQNMVDYLTSLVLLDVGTAEMAGLASGFLLVLLPEIPVIGWIVEAVILAATTLVALGSSAISSAFTSTVYDDLLCTFFAHVDSNGQMSSSQNTDFINDVFTSYSSTVYDVILAHNSTLGAVGWSNAGALGDETAADCSTCGSWCYQWLDGDGFDPAWSFDFGAYNGGTDQVDGTNTDPDAGNTVATRMKLHFAATSLIYFGIDVTYQSYETGGGNTMAIGTGAIYGSDAIDGEDPTPTNTLKTITYEGVLAASFTDLWVALGVPSLGTLAAYSHINRIVVKGTGDCPFGTPNCEV